MEPYDERRDVAVEYTRLGEGYRAAQRAALLGQLHGRQLASNVRLAREMMENAQQDVGAQIQQAPELVRLEIPVLEIADRLARYDQATAAPLGLRDHLRQHETTAVVAEQLHEFTAQPMFSRSWGRLALRDLAQDARHLAASCETLLADLTGAYRTGNCHFLLPSMVAAQTAAEVITELAQEARDAFSQTELAGPRGELRAFQVDLSDTATRGIHASDPEIKFNLALREYGGYAGLVRVPIELDAGEGGVDMRLADGIAREAVRLNPTRPPEIRTTGKTAQARQLEWTATAALAGTPAGRGHAAAPPQPTAHIIQGGIK